MSIQVTHDGVTYTIPQRKEKGWSAQVTALLKVLLEATAAESSTPVGSASVAASGTITASARHLRVSGSGGPTTASATTAIADGTTDGQSLTLEGTDGTNTVTIPDAANTDLNGDCELGTGVLAVRVLSLKWNSSRSVWVEQSRSQ